MARQRGFDADAAAKRLEVDHPPFPFTWRGEHYELPHMGSLSSNEAVALASKLQAVQEQGNLAAATDGDVDLEDVNADAFLELLDLLHSIIPDEGSYEALLDMPGAVLGQLLSAWETSQMEDLGDMGKGRSQPSPPPTSAKRSPSTSQPKGGTSARSRSKKSAA